VKPNDLPYNMPDAHGHFGPYGGSFVSETLSQALEDLRALYEEVRHDRAFQEEFQRELKHFVGRPSPIYHAKRWSEQLGVAHKSTSSAKTSITQAPTR
jgi:tryptophan synthase beta chain